MTERKKSELCGHLTQTSTYIRSTLDVNELVTMKLTKANVVSSLKKAIGDKVITEDLGLVKEENLYYFEGKASCFFDETCTYFSRLSNTRATVYSFVNFFWNRWN